MTAYLNFILNKLVKEKNLKSDIMKDEIYNQGVFLSWSENYHHFLPATQSSYVQNHAFSAEYR